MRARELPVEEWSKIAEADAGREVLASADPRTVKVVVVEDDSGRVVGSWLVLQVAHLECLWIAPEHRGRASVARRLLQGARRALASLGARVAVTHSVSPEIDNLLTHYGADRLPGRAWTLPLRGE